MPALFRSALLALAATCALLLPAAAQELTLVSARIGYRGAETGKAVLQHGGVSGQDTWLPVEVVLNNGSPEPFEGALVLEETGLLRPRRVERSVTLAPHGQKRLRFPFLYDPARGLRLRFVDRSRGTFELSEITPNGAILRGGLARPQERSPLEPLVLVARGQDALATQLGGLQGRLLTKMGVNQREWVTVELENPGELPERAALYHRADVLILDDVEFARISDDQQEAILAWVAGGGRLWVSSLQHLPPASVLGRALPGEVGSVCEERALPELKVTLDQVDAPLLAQPKQLRLLTPREGEVSWRGGAEPAGIVHKRHGEGWIMHAGFRITRAGFDRLRLIRELLSLHVGSRRPPLPTRQLISHTSTELRQSTVKRLPELWKVVSVIVAYALLGVVLPFLVFRRSNRLELAWGAMFFGMAVATGVVLWLGKLGELDSRVVRIGVVNASEGPALRTNALAVFSSHGGPLTLEFEREVEAGVASSGGKDLERGTSTGDASWVIETNPQDTTLVGMRDLVALPGRLRYRLTGPGRGALESSGGWRLRGALAFDSDGVQVPQLDVPAELKGGDYYLDPELRQAMKGARKFVKGLVASEGPLALVWWEGPTLQRSIPELAVDVAIVRAEPGWGRWGKRSQLPVRFGPAVYGAQGNDASWDLYAALPDPTRLAKLSVVGADRSFKLWHVDKRAWFGVRAFERYRNHYGWVQQQVEVPGTLQQSPLGVVWGRVYVDQGQAYDDPDSVVRLQIEPSYEERGGGR